jgi:predicted ATPase/DNA-binding SARP family transcriptional activator
MPPRLGLEFLGLPQVHLDDTPVATDRRKAIALIAYLAVNDVNHSPQKYSRDSLSALLWPDYDQARAFSNLRRTIWEIHQVLGESWLIAERESVCLNEEAKIDLDVARFLDLISQGHQQTETALRVPPLGDAVKLYRNHFLTGFSLKDAPNFNEWAFAESENLRRQLAEALIMLIESYCAQNQTESAIPYARRLVALDPLNESAHRQLMEVYLQGGQHSAALKQYQIFEQILRKELNLDPQPETRSLYKKIRKGEVKPVQVKKSLESITPPHNLPLQLSTFIGREKQQNEMIQLIAKRRLVTLVGAGGIGKTRLSLQVGQRLLNNYPDGVWFIALDSLSDPTLVPQTVAAVFDIHDTTGRPITQTLIDSLREKTALLIFDNCEHLLESCAQLITAILQDCPNVKIFATSRGTLNLTGETVIYIPSLSIPEQDVASDHLTEYESIGLFTERAALVQLSFRLTNQNAQAVVEICRKVDGIPLAIELAAARVDVLQVEEILRQLQDSFALLASDSIAILPRHQTLQASMDWSWGLLTVPERTLLQQLSVFAGGWTLETAQAVCDGDVLGLTSALVKKSLIVVNQVAGRETRYRFHEIVREYALRKLSESDYEGNLQTRHLTYFLSLAEHAEAALRGQARVEWMERLDDELDNLRAALSWADKIDVEAGLYLAGRLMRYWESSDLQEGIRWLEKFLHKPESQNSPLARAVALHTYGWLLTWLQRFRLARTVTEESLMLFQTLGDQQGEIDTLISLANIDQFVNDLDSGTKRLHRALDLSQALGDRWRQAVALGFLGWDRRDQQQAFANWEKAIQLYREVGDQIYLANLLSLLAQFRVLNGDIEVGEKYLDESILLWHSNKRANAWEHPKIVKSLILLIHGDYEQAYAILQEALISAQETGNRMSYLWSRVRLGYVALRAGNLVEAHSLLVETLQDFHKDGYTIGAVFALEGLAALLIATSKPEKAARLIGCADATREKIPDMRPLIEEADMYRNMMAILAKIGPSAFEVVYDEGRAMTLEEAVKYALED